MYYVKLILVIVYFYIKMIMIGIKCELQEQLQYKKLHKNKVDVSASIGNNFNSYLTVTSSIYIPYLQLIIYKIANHMLII